MLSVITKFKNIKLTRYHNQGVFVREDEYELYKSNNDWAIRNGHAEGHIEFHIDITLSSVQLQALISEAKMEGEDDLIERLNEVKKNNNLLELTYQTDDYDVVERFYEMVFYEAIQDHHRYVPMYYFNSFVEIDKKVRKAIDIDLKAMDLEVAFNHSDAA